MIKYAGIIISSLGFVILLFTIIRGRQTDIRKAKAELKMITEAGYGSQHVNARKQSPSFEEQTPVKQVRRNRTLSKESREILEFVEKGRAESAGQATEPRPASLEGSFLKEPHRNTDTMERYSEQPEKKKTDVLPEAAGYEVKEKRKGTDILPGSGRSRPVKGKGTDVMHASNSTQSERDTPKVQTPNAAVKKGTDILQKGNGAVRKGTDVLTRPPKKGTDILLQGKTADESARSSEGADSDDIKKGSTDILRDKKEASPQKKGTDILAPSERR